MLALVVGQISIVSAHPDLAGRIIPALGTGIITPSLLIVGKHIHPGCAILDPQQRGIISQSIRLNTGYSGINGRGGMIKSDDRSVVAGRISSVGNTRIAKV